jgi:hypothetical protein
VTTHERQTLGSLNSARRQLSSPTNVASSGVESWKSSREKKAEAAMGVR